MQACKPGSVESYHLSRPCVTTRLERPTHHEVLILLSKQGRAAPSVTYLVFQPVRFTPPLVSPPMRWALTPPFHPYLAEARRYIFCGTICLQYLNIGSFPLGSTVLCVAQTFLSPDCSRQR